MRFPLLSPLAIAVRRALPRPASTLGWTRDAVLVGGTTLVLGMCGGPTQPPGSNPVTAPTNTAIPLSGTWQILQLSGWSDFRFTLSQTACANAPFVNGPCDSAFAGNATVTPLVCQVYGMAQLHAGGGEYACGYVFPVTGKVAADSVTLNLLLFSDGSSIDFAGYMAANRTIIGDLWFTDAAGSVHSIGGGCDGYPLCLDTPGGQLDFIRSGSTVVAGEVLGRNEPLLDAEHSEENAAARIELANRESFGKEPTTARGPTR
jgi:hypothetical protein